MLMAKSKLNERVTELEKRLAELENIVRPTPQVEIEIKDTDLTARDVALVFKCLANAMDDLIAGQGEPNRGIKLTAWREPSDYGCTVRTEPLEINDSGV